MVIFFVVVLLLVIFVPLVVLTLIYLRGRVVEEIACPNCGHSAYGLREPRCPECGVSLDSGVIRRGSLRSAPRIGFGVTLACLGLVLSFVVFVLLQATWPLLLRSEETTAQWEYEIALAPSGERLRTPSHLRPEIPTRLRFSAEAVFVGLTSTSAPADIEVDLINDDVVVASWKGSGVWNATRMGGMGNTLVFKQWNGNEEDDPLTFDEALVMASLREQVLAQTDSPFAYLFDEEKSTAGLRAQAIAAIELVLLHLHPMSTSTGTQQWWDAQGNVVLVTEGKGTGSITSAVVWPNDIWFAPIYVIPIAIFLGCLIASIRVLRIRRVLVPFESTTNAVPSV